MRLVLYLLILETTILPYADIFSKAEPLFDFDDKCASYHKYAWVVLIRRTNVNNDLDKHVCTGSLISSRHVLTAGACLENLSKEDAEIIAGSTDTLSPNHRKFGIKSNTTYADWFKQQTKPIFREKLDDIAIIEVDVRDTGIGTPDISYKKGRPGGKVKIIGWGHINMNLCPKIPRYIEPKILNNADCVKWVQALRPSYVEFILPEKLTCAASDLAKVGVEGDFGGPVVNTYNSIIGILIRPCPANEFCWKMPDQPNLILSLNRNFQEFINDVKRSNAV